MHRATEPFLKPNTSVGNIDFFSVDAKPNKRKISQLIATAPSNQMASEVTLDAEEKAFQNKYSRQIATMGISAVRKLVKMKILIVGMGGVGIETAKNIILQGTRAVTVFDPAAVAIGDLGVNFCFSEESVGMPRDRVCVPKLQELNKVRIIPTDPNCLEIL